MRTSELNPISILHCTQQSDQKRGSPVWKSESLNLRCGRLRRGGSAYLASCLRRDNGHTLGQTVIRVEVIDRTRRYQLMFPKHRWGDWPPVQNIQADANKLLAIALGQEGDRRQKTSGCRSHDSAPFGRRLVP